MTWKIIKGGDNHTRHLLSFMLQQNIKKMNISSFFDHLNFFQIQNEPDFSIFVKDGLYGWRGGVRG